MFTVEKWSQALHCNERVAMSMSGKQRVPRRPRSVVWYYFDKVVGDPYKAKCKLCGNVCTNVTNTSNLFYHLRHRHPATYDEAERQREQETLLYNELKVKAGKSPSPVRPRGRGRPPRSATEYGMAVIKAEPMDDDMQSTSFSSSQSYGRKVYGVGKGKLDVTDAMLQWLATDMLHPSIINKKGFRNFLSACGLSAEAPSKRTVCETMAPKLVEETKVKVRHELEGVVSVALTAENWMYQETQSFITMTAHFISDSWAVTSYVLETFDCTEDRTEANIAANLKRVTDEWGITESVSVLMSDVPDATMTQALGMNGWEELFCFGRALNNVVEVALASVEEFVRVREKLSEAVSYFYCSTKASDALLAIQQQHNLQADRLRQERAGLWMSCLASMERVVEQYEAVNTVLCFLGKDNMCLCDDEVELIRDVVKLLKPFRAVVEELCTEAYTSVSKLIPVGSLLHQVTSTSTGGQVHEAVKTVLLSEMEQCLCGLEGKPTLAIATLLDPRFKHHAFTDAAQLEGAQERLLELTRVVVENSASQTSLSAPSLEGNMSSGSAASLWGMFDRKLVDAQAVETDVSEADNETRRFFKEVNISRTSNPFKWWRLNEVQYPHLKVLAKRFLCVPATAIQSTRLFYKDGGTFASRRDSFRPSNLNNMLFLNQNLS